MPVSNDSNQAKQIAGRQAHPSDNPIPITIARISISRPLPLYEPPATSSRPIRAQTERLHRPQRASAYHPPPHWQSPRAKFGSPLSLAQPDLLSTSNIRIACETGLGSRCRRPALAHCEPAPSGLAELLGVGLQGVPPIFILGQVFR